MPVVNLTDTAAEALEAVRRRGQNVRFEVRKACEQERWRLKVVYEQPDPESGELRTIQLGLLWAEDRSEVTSLVHEGQSARCRSKPARPSPVVSCGRRSRPS